MTKDSNMTSYMFLIIDGSTNVHAIFTATIRMIKLTIIIFFFEGNNYNHRKSKYTQHTYDILTLILSQKNKDIDTIHKIGRTFLYDGSMIKGSIPGG